MAEATKSSFELTITAFDKFSAPFKKMSQAFSGPMRNLDRLNRKIDESNSKKLFGGAFFEKMGSQAQGLVSLGRQVATFGAVASGGILALTSGAAGAISEMQRMAKTAGVSTQAWQQYSYAAQMAGVDSEELESVLKDFSAFALMAGQGAQGEIDKFDVLGIDFKNAKGEIKDNETLLMELADKVKYLYSIGQGDKATGMMDEVFGDSGSKILKLLEQGQDGILQLRQEAEKMGLVIDDEQIKASQKYNKSLKGLIFSVKSFGFGIANELFPPATAFLNTLKQWLTLNKQVFTDKFSGWIKSIKIESLVEGTKSFLQAFEQIPKIIMTVGEGFAKFSDMVGGTKNALALLGLVIAGPLIGSIVSLGAAIVANPIGLIATAVAALGAGAYAVYENWDAIVQWFGEIDDKLSKMFVGWNLGDAGRKLISTFGEGVASYWNEFMAWFKGKFGGFTNMLSKAKNLFKFGSDSPSPTSNLEASGAGEDFEEKPSKRFGLGKPVNITANGMPSMTQRTESVERQEITVRLQTEPGVKADVQGDAPKGLTMRTGAQGYAGA